MTHRFIFKTDAGEVVSFDVWVEFWSELKPSVRSKLLWELDHRLTHHTPFMKPEDYPRYHAWTTEVLACAVSKVKRRLYVKVKG